VLRPKSKPMFVAASLATDTCSLLMMKPIPAPASSERLTELITHKSTKGLRSGPESMSAHVTPSCCKQLMCFALEGCCHVEIRRGEDSCVLCCSKLTRGLECPSQKRVFRLFGQRDELVAVAAIDLHTIANAIGFLSKYARTAGHRILTLSSIAIPLGKRSAWHDQIVKP